MQLDKDTAQQLYDLKILLELNSGPPSDTKYGWMTLPSQIQGETSIRIEERVGLYAGKYYGSVGAPGGHGLCSIGSFSYSYSPLPPGLEVGRYCSISNGLRFLDSHHPTDLLTTSAMTFRPQNHLWDDILREADVGMHRSWHIHNHKGFPRIGNDVWIGRDVTLAMGITIGDGAIIAANSVVTKDVPPYSLIGGNPAEYKRSRYPTEIVQRLLKSQWWKKDPVAIARIAQLGIEKSLDYLDSRGDEIDAFEPRSIKF